MASHLTPTQIVDKNGKKTTVHRKVSRPSSDHKIPSPVPASQKSDYQPTDAQMATKTITMYQSYSRMEPSLASSTGMEQVPSEYIFQKISYEASDVQVYGVASVTSIGNANALLTYGIRTEDEAVDFLVSLGLERLIEDNSALTDAALREGVSSRHLVEMMNSCDATGYSVRAILDATEIHRRVEIESISVTPTISQRVLFGDISKDDVLTIGAGILGDRTDTRFILSKLGSIKRGQSEYDAVQLRKYIEATRTEIGFAAAIQIADRFGIERVLALRDKLTAVQNVDNIEKFCKVPAESVYDVTVYHDRFRNVPSIARRTEIQDVVRLYYAGVEPELAMNLRNKDMTVDMIIEAHQQGIHGAVADGWI